MPSALDERPLLFLEKWSGLWVAGRLVQTSPVSGRVSPLNELRRELSNARGFLVVDFGFLGDTVHTVPALREIKRALPTAQLHVLTTSIGGEILNMASCVDRVIPFPLTAPSPPWWKHTDKLRELRRNRYDCAISFSGSDRNVIVTALSGAQFKVVHDNGRPHLWRKWLISNWVPRVDRGMPVFEQHRQLISRLGFDLQDPKFGLEVSPEEHHWACEQVPPKSLHFSINASSHVKEWPLPQWIDFARRCLGDFPEHRIVATSGPARRELKRLGEFMDALSADERSRIIAFDQPLSIPRLAAVLERCEVHVGADSGVLNLAMGMGRPTVSVFRDYEGLQEWRPRGPRHRSVLRPCACEAAKVWGEECSEVAQCLNKIAPEEVLGELRDLMGVLSGT